MMGYSQDYERRVEPLASHWRSFAWSTGIFDTARRDYTDAVEGVIRTPQHVIMATLSGGADHLEVTSDCGHRYSGPDRSGAVSFVPAHCERRLAMRGVRSEWGSIALSPSLFELDGGPGALAQAAFSNVEDGFVLAMVSEFARLNADDGGLEPLYCEAMSLALAHHLVARYGTAARQTTAGDWKLPPWRLRRVVDYIEAHLGEPISIADLADVAGLSPGYFHRAFRATTGRTPLQLISERRIQHAVLLLHRGERSVASIALKVGFVSPSHFTRTFRQLVGVNPSAYLKDGGLRAVATLPITAAADAGSSKVGGP